MKYGDPAQNPLNDDSPKCSDGQTLQPAALIGAPGPEGKDDGAESDQLGNHAMAVFKANTADHAGNLVERSERSWPVRNRESSVVAGHQGPGDDQYQRRSSDEYGEVMQAFVVGKSERLQWRLLVRHDGMSLGMEESGTYRYVPQEVT